MSHAVHSSRSLIHTFKGGRLAAAAAAVLILLAPAAAHADVLSPGEITALQVTTSSFVPNLTVSIGSQTGAASFLDFYNSTGGVTRWGYPTSEVFQEEAGNLVQYYQRGVLDWHWRGDLSAYVVDRRLGWDYFGGDRAGAGNDQGTEPDTSNPYGEEMDGPWGHTVSNQAVDGSTTGFKDFFDKLGGVDSFGYAKSEARVDTRADGALHISAATTGFIRQYFQGAVLEYHPDTPDTPVQLRLLGDDLRDRNYPNNAWQSIPAFQAGTPESAGEYIGLDSLVATPVSAPAFQVVMRTSVSQGHTF